MKIIGNGKSSEEQAFIISDLNGRIIHVSRRAATGLGRIRPGESISKFIDLDYVRKMSFFDNKIDIIVPSNCKYNRAMVRIMGTGAAKTLYISFVQGDESGIEGLANDKKLFASYFELIGSEVSGNVELSGFLDSIINCMRADLRFAYRKFETSNTNEKAQLYVNFTKLCTLTVGTIVALNEIEYRNPFKIWIDNAFGEYVLNISVNSNTFIEAEGLHSFAEAYPKIAMRLLYMATVCEDNGIKYNFSVKPNKLTISYVVSNMINETGKFSYSAFLQSQKLLVSYIMDLFSTNDASKEEQEE